MPQDLGYATSRAVLIVHVHLARPYVLLVLTPRTHPQNSTGYTIAVKPSTACVYDACAYRAAPVAATELLEGRVQLLQQWRFHASFDRTTGPP